MSNNKQPTVTPRHHLDPTLRQLKDVLDTAVSGQADPKITEGLQSALTYADMREDYTLQCTSQESDICRQVTESTLAHPWAELKEQGNTIGHNWPVMLTGQLEGQFLKSLISAQRARRVLDVGMYTGYSALAMAEALPAGGELVTLDIDPYLRDLNQPFFDKAPQGRKITIRLGRALDTMREMAKEGQSFDFIFLDADKSEYIDYLKLCLDEGLLAESGTIVVDNAFRGGMNYLPSDATDATRLPYFPSNGSDASRIFGEHVTNDQRLHKVLLPIRDGIMLIRRFSEVERDL